MVVIYSFVCFTLFIKPQPLSFVSEVDCGRKTAYFENIFSMLLDDIFLEYLFPGIFQVQ